MAFQLVYCDVGFIVADWVFVGILQPCNRRKHKTGFLKIHGGHYYVKVIIFPDWTCLPLSWVLCWELLLSHVCPCIVRINFAEREVFISQVLSFSPFLSEGRFFFFLSLAKILQFASTVALLRWASLPGREWVWAVWVSCVNCKYFRVGSLHPQCPEPVVQEPGKKCVCVHAGGSGGRLWWCEGTEMGSGNCRE